MEPLLSVPLCPLGSITNIFARDCLVTFHQNFHFSTLLSSSFSVCLLSSIYETHTCLHSRRTVVDCSTCSRMYTATHDLSYRNARPPGRREETSTHNRSQILLIYLYLQLTNNQHHSSNINMSTSARRRLLRDFKRYAAHVGDSIICFPLESAKFGLFI